LKYFLTISLASIFVISVHAQNVDLGTDAERDAGKQLYEMKCAHCHGADGTGDSAMSELLRPAPRNFTSSTFKFRTTASGELPSDEDIKVSIRKGMPGTAMPPWPSLSESEVTNLMYYLKTFSDDFAGVFGEVTPLAMPDPPSMSDESIIRGREVYIENSCADCHGEQGRGDGPSAPTLEDTWNYPIRAADLTKRWAFRGGSSRGDIFRTFTTGLDGSPMPSFDIQPPEDQWNLVDYVYSLSRDEAEYGTLVVASNVAEPVDVQNAESVFESIDPVIFAIVGQVIEPGRSFFPGVNSVEVKAVVSPSTVAIMLQWNDMSAETVGLAGPGLAVSDRSVDEDTSSVYADAIAVQFPSEVTGGNAKPYFLFGDRKLSADLWFADLGMSQATHYVGRGADNLQADDTAVDMSATFADGQWTVVMQRDREVDGHAAFAEGSFVPMSFSVWDGFNRERGNRRGLTTWYSLYIDAAVKESPVVPMMAYGFGTLLLGLMTTFLVRRKFGDQENPS
jgi:DMSO reductase family type II enzyme heme b subunit